MLTTNFNFMSDQSLLLPNRLTFYSSLISLTQATDKTDKHFASHRFCLFCFGRVLPWAPNVHVPASPVIPLTYPCSAFLTTGMFEVTALLIARYWAPYLTIITVDIQRIKTLLYSKVMLKLCTGLNCPVKSAQFDSNQNIALAALSFDVVGVENKDEGME